MLLCSTLTSSRVILCSAFCFSCVRLPTKLLLITTAPNQPREYFRMIHYYERLRRSADTCVAVAKCCDMLQCDTSKVADANGCARHPSLDAMNSASDKIPPEKSKVSNRFEPPKKLCYAKLMATSAEFLLNQQPLIPEDAPKLDCKPATRSISP